MNDEKFRQNIHGLSWSFRKGASANGEKLMEDCWIMGVPSKMETFQEA